MNSGSIGYRLALRGILVLGSLSLVGCTVTSSGPAAGALDEFTLSAMDPDNLGVVDCLLPGQIRRLGARIVTVGPRRLRRTLASVCEIQGGEYVAFDRANFDTALAFWRPLAEDGDAKAQTFVGEIHERGLGREPDYTEAARWYRMAADQGFERAQLRLGRLYEEGRGVPRDLRAALELYRRSTGQRLVPAESLEQARAQLAEIRRARDLKEQELQRTRAQKRQVEARLRQTLAQARSRPASTPPTRPAAPQPAQTTPPAQTTQPVQTTQPPEDVERSLRELSNELIVLTDQEENQQVAEASLSGLASIAASGW